MFEHLTQAQALAILTQVRPLVANLISTLNELESGKTPISQQGEIDAGDIVVEEEITYDPQREVPEINEVERMAVILAVMQEYGSGGQLLFDEDVNEKQRQILIHAILNRMLLPDEPYSGHWNIAAQISSPQVADYVLNGMPGDTRAKQIAYAFNTFYAGKVDVWKDITGDEVAEHLTPWYPNPSVHLSSAIQSVDEFLASPPEDFTGGAISWIHIDNEDFGIKDRVERAEAIAKKIRDEGQDCIESHIRCKGVDPIINGDGMVVRAEGVTVYINMNYTIPSSPDEVSCSC